MEQKPSSKSKWKIKALVIFFVLMGVLSFAFAGVFIAAAYIPTQIGWTSELYEPIEDRSGRRLQSEGCALTEVAESDGCRPANVSDIREEEVVFRSRLTDRGLPELRGTISVPVGEALGRRPGMVLISGSGPNGRDMPVPGDLLYTFNEPFAVFRHLAHHLTRLGFVVIRYDKRTFPDYRSDHQLNLRAFLFTDFIDDARDAIDALAGRPEVDPEALIVMGASQGGQFAPFVADNDERVVAVVMLAGTTQTFDDLIEEQVARQIQARTRQFDYSAHINSWFIPMPWTDCFETIDSGEFEPEEHCFAGVSTQAWVQYFELERETADVMQSLDCPIMAVQGTADVNIHPEEIPRMQQILSGRDAELHRIADMGHTLTNTVDPQDPPVLHPELLERIDGFLGSVRITPNTPTNDASTPSPESAVQPE